MESPCLKCKRKPDCPKVCYPKRDWIRHRKKMKKKRGIPNEQMD